jgi:hypothetical protein
VALRDQFGLVCPVELPRTEVIFRTTEGKAHAGDSSACPVSITSSSTDPDAEDPVVSYELTAGSHGRFHLYLLINGIEIRNCG